MRTAGIAARLHLMMNTTMDPNGIWMSVTTTSTRGSTGGCAQEDGGGVAGEGGAAARTPTRIFRLGAAGGGWGSASMGNVLPQEGQSAFSPTASAGA